MMIRFFETVNLYNHSSTQSHFFFLPEQKNIQIILWSDREAELTNEVTFPLCRLFEKMSGSECDDKV